MEASPEESPAALFGGKLAHVIRICLVLMSLMVAESKLLPQRY